MSEQIAIAQLASKILGDPERYLDSFSEFFEVGITTGASGNASVSSEKLRNLSLLSATTVIIDILPSLVMNDTHDDGEDAKKSTKDRLSKQKSAGKVLECYDELLQKLSRCKLVRGPSVMLSSALCSRVNLGVDRVSRLVSTVISLGCLPGQGLDAIEHLKARLSSDSRDFTDNFEIVRLIVSSICREKTSDRLNLLLPVLDGLRLATVPQHSNLGETGRKVDRQLARDMATGRGDFLDSKKIKQNEALILSDLIALYVRVLRASSTFTSQSVLIAINGISQNVGKVNADLALELEDELLKLAKKFLTDDATALLGATALSALLSISKGVKGADAILSNSIVSSTEVLVPIALNKLVASQGNTTDLLVTLCKGAISIAAQFGSDKCLVLIAKALLDCLCTQFDDKSKVIVELLISIASRSPLVRSAIDSDGVLVDDDASESIIGKTEITLYYQSVCLLRNYAPDQESANLLLGHFGKHCKQISAVSGHQAILTKKRELETALVAKKRSKGYYSNK